MAKDTRPRLRAPPLATPFRIVLVEPEIPQNTGNIARLAAATQSPLHLVGRLGFRIDEKAVRRAGIDYWHLVQLEQHLDFAHFVHAHPGARLRMSELARAVVVSKSGLTTIVDGMEEAGLVRREVPPGDRRSIDVVMTAAGRKRFQQARKLHRRGIDRVFCRHLSPDEGEVLTAILSRLKPPT